MKYVKINIYVDMLGVVVISLIALISYCVGILSYSKLNNFIVALVFISLLIIIPVKRKKNKIKDVGIIVAVIMFFVGFFSMGARTDEHFRPLNNYSDEYVTLYGYIDSIPTHTGNNNNAYMRVEKIEYIDKSEAVDERIFISSSENIKYSQRVKISGFLENISQKNNRYDYDYQKYFMTKNVFYKMYADSLSTYGEKRIFSITYPVNTAKIKISKIFEKLYPVEDASFLKCIMLGDKKSFEEGTREKLYETGIMKNLYSGYLHIMLIFAVVSGLYIFMDKKKQKRIIICILILYIMFNTDAVTPLRNAILSLMMLFALKKKGYYYYPILCCQSALVILLFNPTLISSPNFIITYSFGIMLFTVMDPMAENLKFIKNPLLRRYLIFTFVSLFGMAPLIAYFYEKMATYSLILSIVCMPIVAIIILSSLLVLVEYVIFSHTLLFGFITSMMLKLLKGIVYLADLLPFNNYFVAKTSAAVIIIYFLIFLLIRFLIVYGVEERKTKFCIICCIVMMITIFGQKVVDNKQVELNFVNVGMADGSFIKMPGGEIVTVDGGGTYAFYDYDTGKEMFLPYLKRAGIFKVDLAIVSHYHEDHILGVIAELEDIKVKRVLLPDTQKDNPYRLKIEQICKDKDIEILYAKNNQVIEFFDSSNITVLSGGNNNLEEENDNSLMFYVNYEDFSALFVGDAEVGEEKMFIDKFHKANVLKVGHHGSKTSTSQELLDRVEPEVCVISVGKNNVFGFPDSEVVKRIKKNDIVLYRTDENGDIRIRYKNGKITQNKLK